MPVLPLAGCAAAYSSQLAPWLSRPIPSTASAALIKLAAQQHILRQPRCIFLDILGYSQLASWLSRLMSSMPPAIRSALSPDSAVRLQGHGRCGRVSGCVRGVGRRVGGVCVRSALSPNSAVRL